MWRLLLATIVLAGCAGYQSAHEADLAPCVPPGMAPVSEWGTHTSARPQFILDQEGTPVRTVEITYQSKDGEIMAWWLGGMIVAIDRAPSDPNVPILYDEGLADGPRLRIGGTANCVWKALSGQTASAIY